MSFLNPEMLPGISETGTCIEVAARSGTWESECPLLCLFNQNYRHCLNRPRSLLLPRFEPRTRDFIVRSVAWLVTLLFACVCGLTCCRRGRSATIPHKLTGFSTLLPPKWRLKWFPRLPRTDLSLNPNALEQAVVWALRSLPSGPRATLL